MKADKLKTEMLKGNGAARGVLVVALCLLLTLLAEGQGRRLLIAPRAVAASGLLIDENFEGTGTPTGWGAGTGSPNFDNTLVPIAGAQDLKMDPLASTLVTNGISASGEVWLQMEAYLFGNVPGGVDTWFYFSNAGLTEYFYVQILANGTLKCGDQTGISAATADAMTHSQKYVVWLHARKGTGADAFVEVEFSTTSTRTGTGNKYQSFTTGGATANMTLLSFNRTQSQWGNGIGSQFDNVKVSNTGWPP